MIAIARLTEAPLSLDEHVSVVAGPRQGAIASFVGTVRDHDPSVEGTVTHLEYSAHPDAAAVLVHIADDLCGARDDVSAAVSHRIGLLGVGDAAIVAAVSSAHRAEAFDVCRELVERIKSELPVWKREILADGTHTWVGIS